jgi:hypothetical protein
MLGASVLGAIAAANWPWPMPCAGTWSHHNVEISAAPGAGQNYTFSLRKNGASTLPVTIANLATQGSNLADTVAVVAGDGVNINSLGSAGVAGGQQFRHCMIFEPTIDGQQPFFGLVIGNAATEVYFSVGGGQSANAASETQSKTVVPFAGKFKLFYARSVLGALGVGQTCTVTLRKNGVDTALVLAMVAGDTDKNDIVTEVSFAAGDEVSLRVLCNAGTFPRITTGICFIPTDSRLWFLTRPFGLNNLTAGAVAYSCPNLGDVYQDPTWGLEVGAQCALAPFPKGVAISGIAAKLAVAPGAGTSRTLTVRKNQIDSALAVTITDLATFGIATGFIEPVDFDMLSVSNIKSGGAAAGRGSFAIFGATSTVTVTAVVPNSGERNTP